MRDPAAASGAARGVKGLLNLDVVVWTPADVWATLVWITVDQLQINEDTVRYDAR